MPTTPPMAISAASAAVRTAFEGRDFSPLADVLADDVVFRSPVLHEPWRTMAILQRLGPAMVTVLDDVRCTALLEARDVALLRLDGRVAGLDAECVFEVRVGDDGRIADMAMFIRPLSALKAVAAGMAAALDPDVLAAHGGGARRPAT